MTDTLADVWLRVPARAENVAVVRQALTGLCEALEAPPKAVADIKLAATEACTNVVVHAYAQPGGDDAWMEVEAQPDGSELSVIVRDYGRGISPRTENPGLGLGLPLIAALSGTVEIRSGADGRGTEVAMAFSLEDDALDGNGG
jgi:anti-sigma regulatory factor (Ser/Thr protein kinase)